MKYFDTKERLSNAEEALSKKRELQALYAEKEKNRLLVKTVATLIFIIICIIIYQSL